MTGKTNMDVATFFRAVSQGNVPAARRCLRAGTPVDLRFPVKLTGPSQAARQTALMVAAAKGRRSLVVALLAAGADPNALNEFKQSALARAVIANEPAIVGLLLRAGANPNQIWAGGDFALREAAGRGINLKIVKLLLEHGANVRSHCRGSTALHVAACQGRTDVAKLLLKAGADANGPRSLLGGPLSCAIAHRQTKMINLLLKSGVDAKRQPEALGLAASNGMALAVRKLLAMGFDPNSRAFQGRTPLQHARARKHNAIAELLINAGAKA